MKTCKIDINMSAFREPATLELAAALTKLAAKVLKLDKVGARFTADATDSAGRVVGKMVITEGGEHATH